MMLQEHKLVYLDYAANYPVKKEVLNEFINVETNYIGNYNSTHALGRQAKAKFEEYNNGIKRLLKLDNSYDIIYTSSATEANNLAIKGIVESYKGFGKKILVSEFEHNSVNATLGYLKTSGYDIEFYDCQDLDDLKKKMSKEVILVISVLIDSETGLMFDVEAIREIADRHGLKVIYDAAHAFGSKYKGKSLLNYGDISTCSFHATKLFHTIEGGACVVRDKAVSDRLELEKRFGHQGDEHFCLGINAKQDEFNAAMGLANFAHLDEIIVARKHIVELYDSLLSGKVRRPKMQDGLRYNYAYYPVVFENEKELLSAFERLSKIDVFPRRYFYPSLNQLPYLQKYYPCPVSEDITTRIACLPLYIGLQDADVERICEVL